MRYIYDENGNLLVKKHQGTDEEFQMDYPEQKIYISDLDLGEKAIVEGETIRAMTRLDRINQNLEELQDGEYIKDNEIITVEKPNNFHFWDKNTNEWFYDQELEISSLEDELGSLEIKIYMKNNEIELLKKDNKTFAAKKLEKEVIELQALFDEKILRYEELEG